MASHGARKRITISYYVNDGDVVGGGEVVASVHEGLEATIRELVTAGGGTSGRVTVRIEGEAPYRDAPFVESCVP